MSYKLSKSHNDDISDVSRHAVRNSSRLRQDIFVQSVLFWSFGFMVTSRKKLLEVWSTRSVVINDQSWSINKFLGYLTELDFLP